MRSQMDLRVCFRVREPRDVDLILGQGMLRAGWNAHKLNARSYEVKDQVVTETAACYAGTRPELDEVSRQALAPPGDSPRANAGHDPAGIPDDNETHLDTDDALWVALRQAPDEGTDIGELMRITGLKRTKLYRHLREHAETGCAVQVSRGRWRARTTEEPSP